MVFTPDPYKTLQIQMYEYLHHKIVNGDITPGKRVVEQQIAEETGVSRSPIREAIKQLKSEGLVESHPRGGVRIYRATSNDFKYLYECRLSLEPLAASLAAQRSIDMKRVELGQLLNKMRKAIEEQDTDLSKQYSRTFHEFILECSGNPFLIKMMNQLYSLLLFYRNIIVTQTNRLEDGFLEHEEICKAIINRDADSAHFHMKNHIQKDYDHYVEKYEYNPELHHHKGIQY